jgi:hypothetical protein
LKAENGEHGTQRHTDEPPHLEIPGVLIIPPVENIRHSLNHVEESDACDDQVHGSPGVDIEFPPLGFWILFLKIAADASSNMPFRELQLAFQLFHK